MAMGSKKYAAPVKYDPKPHCPVHDKKLVVTMIMPSRRMVGVCPEPTELEELAGGEATGHHVHRNEWVNR